MSSQQELIDVINDISKKQNRSYDTPATVLRVDGDTVWVHIDGGVDETPVNKTINCSEGETVQVRIANGSAFLVGNASSPPTDDTTANIAHFVAEEADVKAVTAQNKAIIAEAAAEQARVAAQRALVTYQTYYILAASTPTQPTEDSHTGWSTTEPAWSSSSTDNLYYSIRTEKGDGTITWGTVGQVQSYADLVILKNAIISTVQSDYVAQGSSGVTSLSSTMYQNANGVNIYNGNLAVGDSYAHIDGDSFDLKEVTTAGSIDDSNDPIYASFGKTSAEIKSPSYLQGCTNHLTMDSTSIRLGLDDEITGDSGWEITGDGIGCYGTYSGGVSLSAQGSLSLSDGTMMSPENTLLGKGEGTFSKSSDGYSTDKTTTIDGCTILCMDESTLIPGQPEPQTKINGADIEMTGDVYSYNKGYKKTPTVLTSGNISTSTTSYTFSDDSITTDSVIDIYDTIFGFSPTNMTVSTGSCTVTFPTQSSTHKIKLFVY